MSRPIVRPSVAGLAFRAYDRVLHPELFDALAVRSVKRAGATVTVRLTPTGHVLEWVRNGVGLTEAVVGEDAELPAVGRRLAHPFGGERRGTVTLADGTRYQATCQLEAMPPEVYAEFHHDLAADGFRRGLLFHFRPTGRRGLTPLGLVSVEALPTGLSVTAFHTFPDEFTVAKTVSLIEPPSQQ